MFTSKKAGGPSEPAATPAPPSEPEDLKSFSSLDGDDVNPSSLLRVIKEGAKETWEDAELVPDAVLVLSPRPASSSAIAGSKPSAKTSNFLVDSDVSAHNV